MTTFNTRNPLGSTAVKDLYDNAENLDAAVNDRAEESWIDRLGFLRRTWYGMERFFSRFMQNSSDSFQQFLISSGYDDIGDYAAGLVIERRNQIFWRDGELYRAGAALELPYTTTGDWIEEGAFFVSVGDAALRQQLADTDDPDNGAQMVAFRQVGAGAVARSTLSKLRDSVSVLDYGIEPGYDADATANVARLPVAEAAARNEGKALYWPGGVYVFNDGIDKTVNWVGDGAPRLGTFPITGDDKKYLRPGYKDNMPGTCLIFNGAGSASATTTRDDRFSTFRYAVRAVGGSTSMRGLAICMDMDVLDADGNITSVATDNRSDYDVGYFCGQERASHDDFVVFGYWKKGGVVVSGANIDYITFNSGSSSGDIGFAVVGNNTNGLSGVQTYGFNFYANDHHSRSRVDNQWGTTALYVDGQVGAAQPQNANIGGHYFSGGCVRTYADNPMSFDQCNSVVFDQVVFEWPIYSDSVGATKSVPVGTDDTYGIGFINCRHLSAYGVDSIYSFAKTIGGAFIHSDPRHGRSSVTWAGQGVLIDANPAAGPSIQFTDDINASASGWRQRLAPVSRSNQFEFAYNNTTQALITTDGILSARRIAATLTGSSTASAPALMITATDQSTGFYRPNANNIGVAVAGVSVATWGPSGDFRPGADNTFNLGSGSFRFSDIYAANPNINTSDEREKTDIAETDDAVLDAWEDVQHVVFRWLSSVKTKGDGARWHFGVIAQQVRDVFASHDIDGVRYGLLCHDAWDAEYEDVMMEVPITETVLVDGEHEETITRYEQRPTGEKRLVRAAGDVWGIRPDQCHFLEAAYQRRRMKRIEARLAALEQQ